MKVKGEENPRANHEELCKLLRGLPLIGSSSMMLDHQWLHSTLISQLCTFTMSIHHVTNSGAKNGGSLNYQQLWGYCHWCVSYTHAHTPLSTWPGFKCALFALSANNYRWKKVVSARCVRDSWEQLKECVPVPYVAAVQATPWSSCLAVKPEFSLYNTPPDRWSSLSLPSSGEGTLNVPLCILSVSFYRSITTTTQ